MRTYEINREKMIDTNKEIVLIEEIGRHIERREAGKDIFSDLQRVERTCGKQYFLVVFLGQFISTQNL